MDRSLVFYCCSLLLSGVNSVFGPTRHWLGFRWVPFFLLLIAFSNLPSLAQSSDPACLDCEHYQNRVQNGDFETGVIAPGITDLLTGVQCRPDYYDVVTTSMDLCSSFNPPAVLDRTNPGTGSFMMIDGKPRVPATVWEQTVLVNSGQVYSFSFWVNYAAAASYPLTLNVLLEGEDFNNQRIASFSPEGDGWVEYCTTWVSNTSGVLSLIIQQPSGGSIGYDYGIDDIFFGTCATCNITPEFNWSLDTDGCILELTDQSQIASGTITGYDWMVTDLASGQVVHTSNQAASSFSIPSNVNLNYEICLEVTGDEGACVDTVCDTIQVACPDCDYDDLLSAFTGVRCANDLILDLTSWSANWGSQLTLTPAFGQSQTIGINGGQVYDLQDYFQIACGIDSCGANPQYQLLFEADHPFCQFVQVSSPVFEVTCCEPEPCEVTADLSASFLFSNDCSVILEDQSVIQGGAITEWHWEVFDRNGSSIFNSDQRNVTFSRNFGSYVKICLKVMGNDGGCVSETCRVWDGLAACLDDGGIGYSEVTAYPNPTVGEVQIAVSFEATPAQLSLTDASGRKVDVAIRAISGKKFLLEMKDLIRGIYYLNIQHGDQVERRTLVKY